MTKDTKKRPRAKEERFRSTPPIERTAPSSQSTQDTSWFDQFITTGTPVLSTSVSQTTSNQYNPMAHSASQLSKTKIPSAGQSHMARTSSSHSPTSKTSARPKPTIRTSGASQTIETSQSFQGEVANATKFGSPVSSLNDFKSSSQFFEDLTRYTQIVGPERSPLGQIFPPGYQSSNQTDQIHFGQSSQLEQSSTSQVFSQHASWSQLYNDQHQGSNKRTEGQAWRSSQSANVDGHDLQRLKKESKGSQRARDARKRSYRDKGSQQSMTIKHRVKDNTAQLSQTSLDGNRSNSQVWGSTSHLTNSESISSSVYGSASPWSGDTGSAFNAFTTAPSSSMSTIPNSQSFMNNQSRSTQQIDTQSFSQLSVSQSLSASQGSAVRGWCSSQARRSVTTIQYTESSDDVAPSSQTSTIYVSSDSDTDSKDSGTLDVDSELDSNEGDPGGDSDEDGSGDSDTTVRLQNTVMRFDSRAGQSLSRYSYSQPGSQLSQEQDAVYTTLRRRQPSFSSYEGWEQNQSEYSFSQGSEPSQELSDSEDDYSSRLQAFMDCRHGTEDDEAQSQELEYGVGSWFNSLTVPEWLSELDDADGDDDEGLFYEPLKRIRHQ